MIQEKTYKVSRYFDDHFETVIARGLTKDVAEEKVDELNNSKQRAYVEYLVQED